MRKIACLLSAIIVFSSLSKAQEKSVKVKEEIGPAKETYYVKDKHSKIKHGLYKYEYGKNVLINGQFDNGLRQGNWNYKIGNSFTINSFYNNGERDSIWTYSENGRLLSEIRYKNGKRNGNAIGYGKNGEILSVIPYKDSKIEGVKYVYYENGKTKFEVSYKHDTLDGSLKYYDINGKIILHLIYKNHNPYSLEISDMPDSLTYFSGNLKDGNGFIRIFSRESKSDSLFLISEQTYKNGLLDGLCSEYGLNGKLQFTGNFKEGYMTGKWDYYNPYNSNAHASKVYDFEYHIEKDSTDLYPVTLTKIAVSKMVMPKFCIDKKDSFRIYVAQNLKYPDNAAMQGIQGKVFVQFDINETGKIFNVNPLNKANEDLKKEAVRIIKTSPYWIPGFNDFIPVNTRFTFPITFVLQ